MVKKIFDNKGKRKNRSQRTAVFRHMAVALGFTAAAFTFVSGDFTMLSESFSPLTAYADTLSSGSESYRINVLNAIGVADNTYLDASTPATRAEFAKMIVLASSLRDTAASSSASAAANDVPAGSEGSGYIKAALSSGWMRTRLGGAFAPDAQLTLTDASRAVLKMLGYEDSDFGSNIAAGRIELFKSLDLDEGVSAVNAADVLTRKDCVNLIYNLLRTESKNSSTIFGSAVKLALSSSGNELNVTEALESNMVGPILIRNESEIATAVPFIDQEGVSFYYNGTDTGSAGRRYLSSQLSSEGWAIIYYNEGSKTVWTYGSDTGNGTYHCVRGTVNQIYYSDDDIATPSSVVVGNTEYDLNSSEVKFMFSVNGDVKAGDQVVLICKENSSSDEDETDYYAIAVVEMYPQSENTYSNVIYATDATTYVAVDSSGNVVNR